MRDLQKKINSVKEFDESTRPVIYEAAIVSIKRGRDMDHLFDAIMELSIPGMTKQKAEHITVNLHDKATRLINKERMQNIGIEDAIWLYSGAPCYRHPKKPDSADLRRDEAHRAADGKTFRLREGMMINGKRVQPGGQEGCRCIARAALP